MNMMRKWKHIFKLDPAKEISDEHLDLICRSGTDAIMIGGTDNVTLDGVEDLLLRIKQRHELFCILEVSTMEAIIPGFDAYYIPMVLNSKDKTWMMDIQHQGIKEYIDFIDYTELIFEGYCILNEEAKVFKYTNSRLPDIEDVRAYAYMAEHVFHLPVFYVEYSGKYGDVEVVKQAKEQLDNTLLFYGGGIENSNHAKEMKEYADVIIVGNHIYHNIDEALETVAAVKVK
ncbi:heptaprenylglyceryl phosphate synthase [Oceanobacillus chungangensis]|uniref:Heptaprenylglyceryl phosphate synthase n=2 Tax=Oceanobacillus chungangensis TaxID=1229152 RepID=A0A3D8PUQ5_9BACI|nr:heptaprenylglyceryl phosphate synthase [Oceanobacillus chungangensis]RDW18998.1 heptaprenylglyceryl phosphate synthase [Oceanobacillus chungangensis]